MTMSNENYLRSVLNSQEVKAGSPEMKALEAARAEIQTLVESRFATSRPSIRYGGSKAKGTMILADYDLDIISCFRHEDTDAGKTIAEIYKNMQSALATRYLVEPRTTALRVKAQDKRDLHVDVVPGRFIDGTNTVAFLHQNGGPKEYLKTNIQVHIDHVKGSGCTDIIQLAKLWKIENGVGIRTFPLELAVIEALKGQRKQGLSDRFEHVLATFSTRIDKIQIEDPANPTGNDLSDVFDDATRHRLSRIAKDTLQTASRSGWEGVFTLSDVASDATSRVTVLRQAAQESTHRAGPWCEGR